MIIKRNKTVTLWHLTPLHNLESIMEYGLDPSKGKPLQVTEEEWRACGMTGPIKLPYHYSGKVVYLSKNHDDSESYVNHYSRFSASQGKFALLKIEIPESELKRIQCENPKLLGAKTWKDYIKAKEKYEPEEILRKRAKGKSEEEIRQRFKEVFENETKNRVTVRGIIRPEWIEVFKIYGK